METSVVLKLNPSFHNIIKVTKLNTHPFTYKEECLMYINVCNIHL